MSRISGRPVTSSEHVYGLRLCIARWRAGAEGTPLLFLNGIGADLTAAAPLLAQIHGREVWTLDMPGVGASPDALLPYGASTIAAVVMEIADRLGHDILDIAGFSWGGALAQQIAMQFPGRVAGWSSTAYLPGFKALPTLVLVGERDGVMPACYGQMLASLIDGAVLEVVPGSHLFPFTHAAAVAARISAFLDPSATGQQAAA